LDGFSFLFFKSKMDLNVIKEIVTHQGQFAEKTAKKMGASDTLAVAVSRNIPMQQVRGDQ